MIKVKNALSQFLRLPPKLKIHPQVQLGFRNNFISNLLYIAVFDLGESFISTNTILPVFASMVTDSAVVVGLVPALIRAGSLIPSFFLAAFVNDLPQKLPFAKATARISHISPFFLLAVIPFLLPVVNPTVVIWLFLIAVIFRGFSVGVSNLPWQEVIAIVIPSQVRSRFFGVSVLAAQLLGLVGSASAGFILAGLIFPYNFGVSFLIGASFISLSFYFFSRTVEPVIVDEQGPHPYPEGKKLLLNLTKIKEVLKRDQNFRRFLTSRLLFQIGNMPIYFVAVYGIQSFNLGNEFAAIFSVIFVLSGMTGSILLSLKGDDYGPRNVLILSSWVRFLMIVIAILAPTIGWFYLTFFFFGLGEASFNISELLFAMELGPQKERSIYIGLARSLPGMSVLAAPVIAGLLVNHIGYRMMFLVALAFCLLGILFLLSVKESRTVFA